MLQIYAPPVENFWLRHWLPATQLSSSVPRIAIDYIRDPTRPDPLQPDPWMDPTLVHLRADLLLAGIGWSESAQRNSPAR